MNDRVHVLVFLGLLWLPLMASLLAWRGGEDLREKRALAPPPQLGVDPVASLPAKFDRYYGDHFGLRAELILAHDFLRVQTLQAGSPRMVVAGENDFLFYLAEGVLEDHQGLQPFTPEQLKTWQEALEGKQAWLAQRGIAYLFVVAPDKESIYPERLPSQLQRRGAATRMDQLVEYLRSRSSIKMLDLRQPLLAARQGGEVYETFDTHWNDRGALIAYHEICRWLKGRFPDIEPLGDADFQVVLCRAPTDLCPMIGWHGMSRESERLVLQRPLSARQTALSPHPAYPWPNQDPTRAPIATERPGDPRRLVMFHDSFGARFLRKCLAEHFGRGVYLSAQADFETLRLAIERERPNVVIEERVERNLRSVPDRHPEWMAARADTTALRR